MERVNSDQHADICKEKEGKQIKKTSSIRKDAPADNTTHYINSNIYWIMDSRVEVSPAGCTIKSVTSENRALQMIQQTDPHDRLKYTVQRDSTTEVL